jgi:tetratricopeptide (TPR) repeat protein
MNMKFGATKRGLLLSVVCVLLVFAVFFVTQSPSYANGLIYTVQLNSFDEMRNAREYYYEIIETVDKKNLDYLRIEEIGRFYTVRLGRIKDAEEAKAFYKWIKTQLTRSVLMQAYILESRIKMLYDGSSPSEKQTAEVVRSTSMTTKDPEPSAIDKKEAAERAAHEKKGDILVRDKRLVSAAEEYQLALQDDSENAELIWKLANVQYELKLVEDALKNMKKVVDLPPGNNAEWRTVLGEHYYANARLDEAKEQFMHVLSIKPDAADVLYKLGKIYLVNNELNRARESFVEVLELNPGSPEIHEDIGEIYLKQKKYYMAWVAARISEGLGSQSQELRRKLQEELKEPVMPWMKQKVDLYIRQIVVDSSDRAEDLLYRMSRGELFVHIMKEKFEGLVDVMDYSDPSDVDPEVHRVSKGLEVLASPVIVKTRKGYHVIQRMAPTNIYTLE